MIKIKLDQNTIDQFYKGIKKKFKNGFLKKEEKNELQYEISLEDLNKEIKDIANDFYNGIDLKFLVSMKPNDIIRFREFCKKNKKKLESKIDKIKRYFFELYSRLNKKDFIKNTKIKVCPYCNRNYIFNFRRKDQIQATAQLDHFFNKSTYPLLAVSIYNLIPSCSTCNLRKTNKDEEILHPYKESFNQYAKFQLDGFISGDINADNFSNGRLLNENRIKFNIKTVDFLTEEEKNRLNNYIGLFNIEKLYDGHKDIIVDLFKKKEIYNDSYIDELITRYEGTLFKNREDLLSLITGGYITDEEIGKKPLSKFIKDISEELDF